MFQTNRENHVKNNEDVEDQQLKMYCTKKQFNRFTFCGPHNKPHDVHILWKNYHMCLDTKIRHGTCVIRRIPCECTQCTSTLDKPWAAGVLPHQKA